MEFGNAVVEDNAPDATGPELSWPEARQRRSPSRLQGIARSMYSRHASPYTLQSMRSPKFHTEKDV